MRIAYAGPTQEVDDELARMRPQFQQPMPGLRHLAPGVAMATAASIECDILYFRIAKAGRDTQLPDVDAMGMDDDLPRIRPLVMVFIDKYDPAAAPLPPVQRHQVNPPSAMDGLRPRHVNGHEQGIGTGGEALALDKAVKTGDAYCQQDCANRLDDQQFDQGEAMLPPLGSHSLTSNHQQQRSFHHGYSGPAYRIRDRGMRHLPSRYPDALAGVCNDEALCRHTPLH